MPEMPPPDRGYVCRRKRCEVVTRRRCDACEAFLCGHHMPGHPCEEMRLGVVAANTADEAIGGRA